MNSSLVFDLERFANEFDIHQVKLFVDKKMPFYSIASAIALKTYLDNHTKLSCEIVLKTKSVDNMPLKEFVVPQSHDEISVDSNDFIALIMDCKNQKDIENDSYNKTYIVLEVNGETNTKQFAIKSYSTKDALCSAEIVYNGIMAHSLSNGFLDEESLGYIYMALMDITSNFHAHMKPDTFLILQELHDQGVDLNRYNYLYEMKKMEDLRILQSIYTRTEIKDRIAVTIFDKESELYKLPLDAFNPCLEYIRYVNNMDIWFIFIEQSDGEHYKVLIQGNTLSPYDVSKIAKKNGGKGTKKRARCIIIKNNMDLLIDDAIKLRKLTDNKSKKEKQAKKKKRN